MEAHSYPDVFEESEACRFIKQACRRVCGVAAPNYNHTYSNTTWEAVLNGLEAGRKLPLTAVARRQRDHGQVVSSVVRV